MKRKSSSLKNSFMSAKKDKETKQPKGRIILMSITADMLMMLPDNSSHMTEEEIHKYPLAVFKRCVMCQV